MLIGPEDVGLALYTTQDACKYSGVGGFYHFQHAAKAAVYNFFFSWDFYHAQKNPQNLFLTIVQEDKPSDLLF